jgi:hypothetical protein
MSLPLPKRARSPQPKRVALTRADGGKHDPRVLELVRALARQRAAEDHEAEQRRPEAKQVA